MRKELFFGLFVHNGRALRIVAGRSRVEVYLFRRIVWTAKRRLRLQDFGR